MIKKKLYWRRYPDELRSQKRCAHGTYRLLGNPILIEIYNAPIHMLLPFRVTRVIALTVPVGLINLRNFNENVVRVLVKINFSRKSNFGHVRIWTPCLPARAHLYDPSKLCEIENAKLKIGLRLLNSSQVYISRGVLNSYRATGF